MADEIDDDVDSALEDDVVLDEELEPGAPAADPAEAQRHKRAIFSVPIQVVISVGRAHPTIGELLNMRRDSLLPLDTKIDDPVDILVGKRTVARGELQEVEDEEGKLCVRLTEIVDLSQPL